MYITEVHIWEFKTNSIFILIIFDALHIYDMYTLHIDFAYYSVYAFPEMSQIPIGWLMKNEGVSSESPVTTGLFDDR